MRLRFSFHDFHQHFEGDATWEILSLSHSARRTLWKWNLGLTIGADADDPKPNRFVTDPTLEPIFLLLRLSSRTKSGWPGAGANTPKSSHFATERIHG